MIRILIVDDSAVLRQSTKFILESDPELKVVGEAINGAEAVTQVARLKPDVITMDIRMPKMDGLEAIRQIMAENPVPIIVVTSLDLEREMGNAIQVTKLGAVAVLRRPASIISEDYKTFAAQLIRQVKTLSSVKVIHRPRTRDAGPSCFGASDLEIPSPPRPESAVRRTQIIAIGASTGGPAALHQVLSGIPKGFGVPIVIVQHISFGFVNGLASWLNEACALSVKVGDAGERLEPGKVYLAPDDRHLIVDRFARLGFSDAPPIGGHRPSVTTLFQSVAQSFGASALGVILTGMGADGAVGMQALRQAGALTIAQDQASCVVFGMPKEAIALGAIQYIVPLDQIARKIQELVVT